MRIWNMIKSIWCKHLHYVRKERIEELTGNRLVGTVEKHCVNCAKIEEKQTAILGYANRKNKLAKIKKIKKMFRAISFEKK